MMATHRRLGGMLAALLSGAAPAAAQDYNKFVVFDGVKAGAGLEGGALVNTWAGPKKKPDEKVTLGGATRGFERADPTRTDTKNVNGATLAQVVKPVAGVAVAFGKGTMALWDPIPITADDAPKDHEAKNVATADVGVFSEPTLDTKVRGDEGKPMPITFKNAVTATLVGSAAAGVPTDDDKFHSADSWAGVYVKNARTFTKTIGSVEPFALAGLDRVAWGGAAHTSDVKKPVSHVDPFYLTVHDLTTGESTTSEIMRLTVLADGADVFIDDVGIRLAVDRTDPLSAVSLEFSSETPWVTNPYRYGFALTSAGLTVDGDALSLAGWTVTTTTDRIEATYAFGADGAPLDMAIVAPPEALFTAGHEYSYDVGGGGGVASLASTVPEPPTLALAALGLLLTAVAGRRGAARRRPAR